MLRDTFFYLRVLVIALLAGGLFGTVMESSVHAAPLNNPIQLAQQTDTPTDTPAPTDTPTDTLTDTPTYTPSDTPSSTQTPTLTTSPSRTSSPTRTLTATRTPTPTRTTTPTLTPTNTGTLPTPTPTAPAHIVISQFRTIGILGTSDEFIELYNPTGAAVNIGGWLIRRSSGCGNSLLTLVTITSGTILQPGQHFLAAASGLNSSITNADQYFLPGIDNNGGIALYSSTYAIIDQVGMCNGTYYHEGTFLPPLPLAPLLDTPTPEPGTSNQSYQRKPGGNTACYDTNNNTSDFLLISPANPHNRNSPRVMCTGVMVSSPTRTPTRTFTRTPTRTRTPSPVPTAIPGQIVLNEFLPHPRADWNGDGTIDTGDEYIEIINLSTIAINVKGWKLDTGIDSTQTFILPDMSLAPRQIAALFGSQTGLSLRDSGGTVRLLKPNGYIADAFTYPIVDTADQAWCRLPDGSAYWGFRCHPTPGRPNIASNAATPGAGTAEKKPSICSSANSVPQAVILAECGSFGSGITNSPEERLFRLPGRWKWEVFVE